MIILLHGKKIKPNVEVQIINFINDLHREKISILSTHSFYEYLEKKTSLDNKKSIKTIYKIDEINNKIDYLICFGGDGTILDAANIVQDKQIPIVGINTGRLGFLATISKLKAPELLNSLIKKKYNLSPRSLLQIESNETHIKSPFALNEISVSSKENISMINVKVFLNNEYLNTYWADGLIIATPTGSTGYSLSCGGPIVMPKSNNFIITPISAHNLNVRPLIISDNNIITIEILAPNTRKFLLSMDSRSQYIKNRTRITIKKAPYTIKLVEIDSINYFNTLREKLLWGLDKRNYEI